MDLSHVTLVTGSVAAILRSVPMLGNMISSALASAFGAVLTAALLGLPCHLRCHACNSRDADLVTKARVFIYSYNRKFVTTIEFF